MADYRGAIQGLDALIERELGTFNAPGIAVGLTNRAATLHVGVYGLANRDAKIVIVPQTLFQIGSISKAFTSISLLQLHEQGLLDIDEPVTRYLPWFELPSIYSPTTLRHLLSHTAGIITGADDTLSAFSEAWNLRHSAANAPPGEFFHYSNSGYKVLGLVLQTILGAGMPEILRQQILNPLGMDSSEGAITNRVRSRLAVGYEALYDDRPLPHGGPLVPATWFESDTADGAICSTAEDMCHYLRALLTRGQGLLSPASFEQLISPMIATGDDLHGEHYGLGLFREQVDGRLVIGHSGGMVGYTADLLADLDSGLGVVVLTNGPAEPQRISRYALQLLNAAHRGDELPPMPQSDPYFVVDAESYAGRFRCGEKEFDLISGGEHLDLQMERDTVPVESHAPHGFYIPHAAFEMFLLRPEEGGFAHGPDFYIREGVEPSEIQDYPPEWEAYPGHYRSHNPWLNNFRVVLRRGALDLIYPSGEEEPLHHQDGATFRVGPVPRSPERLRFDMLINGKAHQAELSGGAYCRTFTL